MTTCLELTGHQRVVSASLGEDGEVEREESEVDDAGDECEKSDPGDTVHQQVTITQILPRQQTPENPEPGDRRRGCRCRFQCT